MPLPPFLLLLKAPRLVRFVCVSFTPNNFLNFLSPNIRCFSLDLDDLDEFANPQNFVGSIQFAFDGL